VSRGSSCESQNRFIWENWLFTGQTTSCKNSTIDFSYGIDCHVQLIVQWYNELRNKQTFYTSLTALWSIGRRINSKKKTFMWFSHQLKRDLHAFYDFAEKKEWTYEHHANEFYWLYMHVLVKWVSMESKQLHGRKVINHDFFNENSEDATTTNQRETKIWLTISSLSRNKYENYQNIPFWFWVLNLPLIPRSNMHGRKRPFTVKTGDIRRSSTGSVHGHRIRNETVRNGYRIRRSHKNMEWFKGNGLYSVYGAIRLPYTIVYCRVWPYTVTVCVTFQIRTGSEWVYKQ
jgi:hypothetical protein